MKQSNDAWKRLFGEAAVGQRMTVTVKVREVYAHPPGHPLRHVRMDDAFDPDASADDAALVDSIVAEGFRVAEPILVRLESVGGAWRPALVYGSRRYRAALAAEKRMRAAKSPHLDKDGDLKVAVVEFRGDDAELLLARQAEDAQPLKRPHTVRVLCAIVAQMGRQNVEAERIAAVMPRSWTRHGEAATLKVVECVTALWHTVAQDATLLERLESDDVPPGLLPAVLTAQPGDRVRVLDVLLAAHVTTAAGATRALKVAARRAEEVDGGEAPDFADDGPFAGEEDGDGEPAATPALRGEARREQAPTRRTDERAGRPQVRAPVKAVSRKLVDRLYLDLGAKRHVTVEERAFVLGAQCGLNREAAQERVVKVLGALPIPARAALAGVLWSSGLFGADVQKQVGPDVVKLVEDALKPAKAPKAEPSKPAKKSKKK